METPNEYLEPLEEQEQEQEMFDTEVEVFECTDRSEHDDCIRKLERDGYILMYNVENDLLNQHLAHFKQTKRFKAVALVTIFTDPDTDTGHADKEVNKSFTAIWYKS